MSTTHRGTLTVAVAVAVAGAGAEDLGTGVFRATGPVTVGTGRFSGAIGSLTSMGTPEPAGPFTETVVGTVCLDKGKKKSA